MTYDIFPHRKYYKSLNNANIRLCIIMCEIYIYCLVLLYSENFYQWQKVELFPIYINKDLHTSEHI